MNYMGPIKSSEELMRYISSMNRDNSVLQFSIPGKGKFTLVLQEEDKKSIETDVKVNPKLGRMIQEGQNEYKSGKGMSTAELLESFCVKDFES